MQTSGGGNRDMTMLTVPLLMFVAFVVLSGGGVTGVLKTIERTLWNLIDSVAQLFV
jgi:hypothetical protein